jgi:phospholipase/carboxylesterase
MTLSFEVLRRPARSPRAPLIVLLHGHGTDEADLFPLAELFPPNARVVAPRGPIAEDGGYRWYAHHHVGRPIAASIAERVTALQTWIDAEATDARGTWLIGFSGGALMAGALMLSAPHRYAGLAMLHGTLPFDCGVPDEAGRLTGCSVFYGYGELDDVIPRELTDRSRAYLSGESGAAATVRGYRAGHELVPAEERDLARWYASLT